LVLLLPLLRVQAVGDSYWSPETLAATSARYPDLDLSPYVAAVEAKATTAKAPANAKL
jgi:hypothetical protein